MFKSQKSDKLSTKRLGHSILQELIGRNSVRLDLPGHFKIHPLVYFVYTTPFIEEPPGIAKPILERPFLVRTLHRN